MVLLDGRHLTLQEILRVSKGEEVKIAKKAWDRVERGNREIQRILESEKTVYSVNTGVGELARVRIPQEKLEKLQVNIVRSHSVGVGPPLDRETVRVIMLLRLNTLLQGHSGVSRNVVQMLVEFLNRDITPVVPEKGSVGASGDLAPLSHIALALIGEGDVFYRDRKTPASEALRAESITPLTLKAKEGIALINGTQATLGVLTLSYVKAKNLLENAEIISALTLYALSAKKDPFEEKVSQLRPHPGQSETSQKIRSLIEGSMMESERVQDAYSLRCIPQVHGTVRDGLNWVKRILEREINSVTDNPLIFPESEKNVVSAGNFHGQILSLASDILSIVLTTLSGVSERRTFRLLSNNLSGLPAFLTKQGGINSGLMMLQVTQAALVSESKSLSHPASVDSIPTSANQEDFVSMSMGGALRTKRVLENTAYVLAGELIAALQAVYLKGEEGLGNPLKKIYKRLRVYFHPIEEDRYIHPEIELAKNFLYEKLEEI